MGSLLPSMARMRMQPTAPTKMIQIAPKRPRDDRPAGPCAFPTDGMLTQLALRQIIDQLEIKAAVPVARQFLVEQGMLVIGTQPPFPQFLQYGNVKIPLSPEWVSDDGKRIELTSGEPLVGLDGKPIPYQHEVDRVYISVPPDVNAVELPMEVDDWPTYRHVFGDQEREDDDEYVSDVDVQGGDNGISMTFLAEGGVKLYGKPWVLQVRVIIDLTPERQNIKENYTRITEPIEVFEEIGTWVTETATHKRAVVDSVIATLVEV